MGEKSQKSYFSKNKNLLFWSNRGKKKLEAMKVCLWGQHSMYIDICINILARDLPSPSRSIASTIIYCTCWCFQDFFTSQCGRSQICHGTTHDTMATMPPRKHGDWGMEYIYIYVWLYFTQDPHHRYRRICIYIYIYMRIW